MKRLSLAVAMLVALALPTQALPTERTIGKPELVARFNGPMPTGVTVSSQGRIFVNFPRWGDPVTYSVAEVKNGRTVPFPSDRINHYDPKHPESSLVGVQSVVIDPRDRLWILDTGSIKFAPTSYGGPKLVGVDLKSNRVFKKIFFPNTVALPTTYLNDIRFDLRKGKDGIAYITDSAQSGPNGIIVVDLASGHSWRKLDDHPSTKGDKGMLPIVEGQPLMARPPKGNPMPLTIGTDGIAISNDGKRLYYSPLISRKLYSVSTDALADEAMPDDQVAATVQDLGEKGASDGLESDAQGRVYATEYEHNGIMRRKSNGLYETLVHDPRILWPDTLSLASTGYLYFTDNQLERSPMFNRGKDLRQKPYTLWRIRVDATPVRLR